MAANLQQISDRMDNPTNCGDYHLIMFVFQDNDWRVREATHKSQEQLAVKVGKSIAPHLKQLVPIWLTSQYDPYTPAATAAISSFETAFPGHKKVNVLVLFKTPIITVSIPFTLSLYSQSN